MKRKTLTYIVLIQFLLLGMSLFWNYKQYRDLQEQPVKITEKVVVKYVEKKDTTPELKTEKVVGKIKIKKPARSKIVQNCSDSVSFCSDSIKNCSDSLENCSDSIEVDRVQRVYEDSAYTAYVSGYDPKLDSIIVRQKEVVRTITETITLKKKEFRRWNVGLVGGYGYGLNSKEFEPFVGVGVTIGIF